MDIYIKTIPINVKNVDQFPVNELLLGFIGVGPG